MNHVQARVVAATTGVLFIVLVVLSLMIWDQHYHHQHLGIGVRRCYWCRFATCLQSWPRTTVKWIARKSYTFQKRVKQYLVPFKYDRDVELPLYRSRLRRRGKPQRNPTSFLDLPAEVRNQIYSYAIRYNRDINCTPTMTIRAKKQFRKSIALLRTCRQIRQEASSMVYSVCMFRMSSRYPFYRHMPFELCRLLRRLHITPIPNRHGISGFPEVLKDLMEMKMLRELRISFRALEHYQVCELGTHEYLIELKHRLPYLSYFNLVFQMKRRQHDVGRLFATVLHNVLDPSWPAETRKWVLRITDTIDKGHLEFAVQFLIPGYVPLMGWGRRRGEPL